MSLYATGIVRIITQPEIRSFESGSMVCNFLGGFYEGKDKDDQYIKNVMSIEVWGGAKGNQPEVVVDKCKVGDQLLVSGNIKYREWTDKDTGKLIGKHSFYVSRFEFMPRTSTTSEEPVF